MNVVYTDDFREDLRLQAAWYAGRKDEALGMRYATAVIEAVETLLVNPHLGIKCDFRSRKLKELRRILVDRPFHTHLIFYRIEGEDLVAARVISGYRDLQRRLLQAPGAE